VLTLMLVLGCKPKIEGLICEGVRISILKYRQIRYISSGVNRLLTN